MLGCIAALTASCTAISSAHARPIVKIAFFEDLSVGDPLELVSPSFLAMQAAVDDQETGLPTIRIDQFDTRGDAGTALTFANEVATDQGYVAVVVAPFWAEPSAVASLFDDAGLPVISLSPTDVAADPAAIRRRFVPEETAQVSSFAAAVQSVGVDGPYCLGGDASSHSLALEQASSTRLGGSTVRRLALPVGDANELERAVSEVRSSRCRVVGWTGFTAGAIGLRDALSAAGLGAVPIVGGDAMKTRSYLLNAQDTDGTLVTCACADVTTSVGFAAQQLVHDYQAATGLEPGVYAAEAWDAASVLIAAVRAGVAGRSEMGASIARLETYDGVAGAYRFDPIGSLTAPAGAPLYRAVGLRWIETPR
ncbi:MAG: ABC transporter substrate-binding protein [Actinomycetota bacterium]|nr:ABC transporter substrate-binding protein [Actinomycetota bacterium]